jgi:hypothetical protein
MIVLNYKGRENSNKDILDFSTLENETPTLSRNVGQQSSSEAALYPRTMETPVGENFSYYTAAYKPPTQHPIQWIERGFPEGKGR